MSARCFGCPEALLPFQCAVRLRLRVALRLLRAVAASSAWLLVQWSMGEAAVLRLCQFGGISI